MKFRRWIRALIWLFILAILLLIVRAEILDLRYVPSPSMSPTFNEGDWLLLDKFFSRFGEPDRYDLVMFEGETSNGTLFAKRIAGLPGEKIQIVEGDLFLNSFPHRKSIEQFHRLASPAVGSSEDLGSLSFEKGKNGFPLRDGSVKLSFSWPAKGKLLVYFSRGATLFHFEIEFGQPNHILLSRIESGQRTTLRESDIDQKKIGSFHELEIGHMDGRLFCFLDEEALCPPFERDLRPGPAGLSSLGNEGSGSVSFSFSGGEFYVESWKLLRDLDYSSQGRFGVSEVCVLGPEEYFVLGDNSGNSEDSRFFGSISRQSIRGRPLAVVWPPNHLRKL